MTKLAEAVRDALQTLRPFVIRRITWDGDGPDMHKALLDLESALLVHQIETCAQDGKVAVVESGRDCDGVEYHGYVHIIDATLDAYDELHERTASWADGPFRFEIVKPSVAETIKYTSRDLVMEAHEDGHPHSIHSEFP